ncbi:MAG: IS30 family transposase [Candidatus Symbiodolus clandestinus]
MGPFINAYLVTLAERQSRLVLIGKVVDRVETVAQCLSEWLRRVDNGPTIRLDNGGDFAHHDQVAKSSQATVYFAKPYASYQRGTENTNGLIRDFWPKGTDVKPLDDTEIRHREFCLNMPLSVVLGGLTPLEIDTGRSVALICVNPAVYAMCTIVYMIYT